MEKGARRTASAHWLGVACSTTSTSQVSDQRQQQQRQRQHSFTWFAFHVSFAPGSRYFPFFSALVFFPFPF
jgi:hypothetical protein